MSIKKASVFGSVYGSLDSEELSFSLVIAFDSLALNGVLSRQIGLLGSGLFPLDEY